MKDLDPAIRDEIDKLFIRSKERLHSGDKAGAIQDAEMAWKALPEPKFDWDVSKSFALALTKSYRDAGHFQGALNLMRELFSSGTVKPYQDGPRFIIATIYFEMNDRESAKKWFSEADKISKGRCFQGQDKKYLLFYRQITGKQ